MKLKRNSLVNAHILLHCEELECAGLCDKLINSFNEVKEASVVTTGKNYFYVSGIAKINPNKKSLFKRALHSLQTNPNKNSRVKDVKCWLEVI